MSLTPLLCVCVEGSTARINYMPGQPLLRVRQFVRLPEGRRSTRLTRLVGNEKKKRERRRCLGVFSLGILHIN